MSAVCVCVCVCVCEVSWRGKKIEVEMEKVKRERERERESWRNDPEWTRSLEEKEKEGRSRKGVAYVGGGEIPRE